MDSFPSSVNVRVAGIQPALLTKTSNLWLSLRNESANFRTWFILDTSQTCPKTFALLFRSLKMRHASSQASEFLQTIWVSALREAIISAVAKPKPSDSKFKCQIITTKQKHERWTRLRPTFICSCDHYDFTRHIRKICGYEGWTCQSESIRPVQFRAFDIPLKCRHSWIRLRATQSHVKWCRSKLYRSNALEYAYSKAERKMEDWKRFSLSL